MRAHSGSIVLFSHRGASERFNRHCIWAAFLLWPFVGFLLALANFESRSSRTVVYLFLVLIGMAFVVPNTSVDATRYVASLNAISELSWTKFEVTYLSVYSNRNSVDIVQPIVTFVVSRLSSWHGLLFGAFASIFGFFYLRSIGIAYKTYQRSGSVNSLVFLVFLFLVVSIFQINGFRMWTGAWVFTYGAVMYLHSRQLRFVFVVLLSILVHFSFLIPSLVFIAYLIVGNRTGFWFAVAMATFFASELLLGVSTFAPNVLGEGLSERYEVYTNIGYMESVSQLNQSTKWFIKWKESLVFYAFVFNVILVFSGIRNNRGGDRVTVSLYNFSLIVLSLANVLSGFPSGDRFKVLFSLAACFFLIRFYSVDRSQRLGLLNVLTIFPLLIYGAVEIRLALEFFNIGLLFPTPFLLSVVGESISVHQALFGVYN